jgi:antitoxin (DNA-binding transcriptional repressor) of toxin-antitoxin stability system
MYMFRAEHVHVKQVTMTELRRNLFQLVDEALETGEPIVVNRKGQRVVIGPDRPMTKQQAADALLEARWRRYFDSPPEIEEGLTLQEIEEAGEAYWQPSDDPGANR